MADANETRDWRIHADFAQRLIAQARALYASEDLGLELSNSIYALDSTTIDLCLSVLPYKLNSISATGSASSSVTNPIDSPFSFSMPTTTSACRLLKCKSWTGAFGVVSITSDDSKGFPAHLLQASSQLPSGSGSYFCLIVRATIELHKPYGLTDGQRYGGRQVGGSKSLKGIKARPSSILIDLRPIGSKQVTYAIDPSPKNLAYAARLRSEIIAKHRAGTLIIENYFPSLRQKAETFDAWADSWETIVAPTLALTTQREYRNGLGRFREAWGKMRLTDVTPADIVTTLSQISLAAKSFNNIISPLRALLSLAHTLGKTQTDLSIYCKQRPREQAEGPDPLKSKEIERVLAMAGDWRNYFETAIYTGMRPSEQIALAWGDVDLTDRTMTVRAARVRGIEKTTKTSAIRTIRLPDRALEAIRRQQAVTRTQERVFVHPVSLVPFADTQPPSDAWKRICKLAGVRARDARQTRHTYATLMLLAGVKPAFVSRQMGHATAQMFFRTYAKWLDSEDDWREIDKLNATSTVTTTIKST